MHDEKSHRLHPVLVNHLSSYTIPPENHEAAAAATSSSSRPEMDVDINMNLDPQLLEISEMAEAQRQKSNPPISAQSNLRLFPPPLFSRQTIPQGYKFVVSYFIIHM